MPYIRTGSVFPRREYVSTVSMPGRNRIFGLHLAAMHNYRRERRHLWKHRFAGGTESQTELDKAVGLRVLLQREADVIFSETRLDFAPTRS